MKKSTLVILGISFATVLSAQNLQDAITKTDNERFEAAAADYRALIAKDGSKGENYFYYGENYFKSENIDSALIMYKKGTEVAPTNGLNYAGLGKVQLMQGNDKEGNANLFKAKTLGAKNATVYMKIAEAYINVPNPYKNLTEATKLLGDAMKWEPKNPEAHLLMGDCMLEQNPTEGGPAIKEYDEALKLNPKSPKGILRKGKLFFRARNYNLALDYYKQAEAVDPNFAPAYMEKAELYQLAGQPAKALEAINKYLELNGSSVYAHKKLAGYLYLNKKYQECITESESILKKYPNECYMYRYIGYSYFELGNTVDKEAYTKGLEAMNKFFACYESKKIRLIADDYKYQGMLLGKTGKDSLGAESIMKAIAQDSVKYCELYGTIGQMYFKAKKWDKVIYYYERKALCPGKGLTGQDNFDLGRAYFYKGAALVKEASEKKDAKEKVKKEGEAVPYFVKADTCFSRLCQASPNFPTGYYWRGKANMQLDPKSDQWLAKPHLERYLQLVKPEERSVPSNKENVIIACEYLGYYWVKMKDNAKAKEYWNIVKELDPNNEKAKAFFKSPEGK